MPMIVPKPRKRRNSLYLQERDLRMLESIGTARYLTVPALEWLHFPRWRARYQRHLAQGGTPATYQPDSNLYHRLKLLSEGGYLHRIELMSSRICAVGTSAPRPRTTVYALAPAGAAALASVTGRDDLHVERLRPRSLITLEHGVLIGRFYAALRAAIETRGQPDLRLVDWRSEQRIVGATPRVPVPRQYSDQQTTATQPEVKPDATFTIEGPQGRTLFFLELDRGRHPSTWRAKVAAYEAYARSSAREQQDGVRSFTVLGALPDRAQLQRVADATVQAVGDVSARYLFCLHTSLHPCQIGTDWLQLTTVRTVASGSGAGQAAGQRLAAELAPHVLIRPAEAIG